MRVYQSDVDYGAGTRQTERTGCGECEHVGSIIPSLLAGMLKQQDLSHFIYNYGFSHVHCNQNKGPKGNTTSMKFDHEQLIWVNDNNATDVIISNILKGKGNIHTNEYCPFYREQLNAWKKDKPSKTAQKEKIKMTINKYTKQWVLKANDALKFHSLDHITDAVKFTKVINYFVKRCLDNHSTAMKGGNSKHDEDFDITREDVNEFIATEIPRNIQTYDNLKTNLTVSYNWTLGARKIIERNYRAAKRATLQTVPPQVFSPVPPSVPPQFFSPVTVNVRTNAPQDITGDQTRGSIIARVASADRVGRSLNDDMDEEYG